MARDLSKIQIIGNLGKDPEMRYTPNGAAVTDFSVAVNHRRRDQSGQFVDETDWYRVSCWGRLAEIADQYLKKGMRVFIDGRFQARRFTGNDGVERTSLDVNANDLVMLTGPRDEAGAPGNQGGGSSYSPGDDLEDLPF